MSVSADDCTAVIVWCSAYN